MLTALVIILILSAITWCLLALFDFRMSKQSVWVRRIVTVAVVPFIFLMVLMMAAVTLVQERSFKAAWGEIVDFFEDLRECWSKGSLV